MEENRIYVDTISELTKEFLSQTLKISSQNYFSKFTLTISQFQKFLLIYDSGYEKFKNEEDYEAAFYFLRKQEIFVQHCDLGDHNTLEEYSFYNAIKQGTVERDINQRFPNLWFDLEEKYSKECSADLETAKIKFNERWVVTKSIQARCEIFFKELLNEHKINLEELEDVLYQDLSFSGNFPIFPAVNILRDRCDDADEEISSNVLTDYDSDESEDEDKLFIDEPMQSDSESEKDIQQGEEDIELPDDINVISPQNVEFQENFNYTEDKTGGKNINLPSVCMESDDSSDAKKVPCSVGKKIYEHPLSLVNQVEHPQPSTSNSSMLCELIKTQKDKEKIINDGFMYVRSRPTSSTWRCDSRNREKCSATITTKFESGEYKIIRRKFEHTHIKDLNRCNMQKSANKVTAYAKSLGKPTAGKVIKKLTENPDYKPKDCDKRKVQRIRKKVGKNIANCSTKKNKKK